MPPTSYVTIDIAIDKLGDQLYKILDVPVSSDISANDHALAAIDTANGRIDAALRGRYTVPFALAPTELTQAAVDIFRWHLLGICQQVIGDDDIYRYEDALKYLSRLSRGEDRLSIPGDEDAEPAQSLLTVTGRSALGGRRISYFDNGYGCGCDCCGPARRGCGCDG